MSRNLVMCFDGTGGQVRATNNSNVALTYELLDHTDPESQVSYYDPGVGTQEAEGAWSPPARWVTRVAGLAFGAGIRENLGEAYAWLMHEWAPGDQIYLFGFSRGAFTARALSGLIGTVGVLRPGSENLVPYIVSAYARRSGEGPFDFEGLFRLAHFFGQHYADQGETRTAVSVRYLGLWDTVNSVGLLKWQARWPYTDHLRYVKRVRHAVSMDEWRGVFHELLVRPVEQQELEEAWFAGIHSDLGGTYEGEDGLSRISLKWVIDGARQAGLRVVDAVCADRCLVQTDDANGRLHKNGPLWALLGIRQRPIPEGAAVHASVQARTTGDPTYRPRLPANVTWLDPAWTTPLPSRGGTSGGGNP